MESGIDVLVKYINYLDYLDSYLHKCFEDQKPYIHCKEGCSLCCETGLYPYTRLEMEYIKVGVNLLNEETQLKVMENIEKIKAERQYGDKNHYFQCPFLVDKSCSVYPYRGIICRTFGLMQFFTDDEGKTRYHIPSCVSYGLNYSEVYDEEQQIITQEKYDKLEHGVEPLSYNIGLKYLTNNDKTAEMDFGESKAIIDWFV